MGDLEEGQLKDAPSAELGPRLMARLIDTAVLLFGFLIVVVPTLVVGNFGGSFDLGDGFSGFSGSRFVVGIFWTLVVVGYFVVMETVLGQTIGKMAMKLETRGPDGGKPTLEMAINRNLWNALLVVPVVGSMLQLAAAVSIIVSISQSVVNAGWHDRFAGGTRVVDVGAP